MKGCEPMDFYTNVTKRQYSNGKGLPNLGVYDAQARINKAEKEKADKAALEAAIADKKAGIAAKHEVMANRFTLEAYKMTVISELSRFVPLMIMNEGFTRIMMEAMPHDEEYKQEHAAAIETVNRVWLHHLGGAKYLKEQANRTKSSFLQNWYTMIKEDADMIMDDRIEAIQNAQSEEEVNAIVKSGISGDQADKIRKDIDSMGPDQIATMVQNKVLDVVKDESKKQAEDAEFRAEMANRAKEYEEQNNEKGDATVTDADQPESNTSPDEADKTEADDEGTKVDKETEEPKTEAAKLARYIINPVILHEHSLFNAMANSIYHEMINAVKECGDCPDCNDDAVNISTNPVKTKPAQNRVVTTPLMMTSFDDFLNDYQDDMKHVDSLRVANKAAIAGDETRISSEDVLAEALTQYTLLETAMTIKLITPSPKEVKEAAQLYMKH